MLYGTKSKDFQVRTAPEKEYASIRYCVQKLVTLLYHWENHQNKEAGNGSKSSCWLSKGLEIDEWERKKVYWVLEITLGASSL